MLFNTTKFFVEIVYIVVTLLHRTRPPSMAIASNLITVFLVNIHNQVFSLPLFVVFYYNPYIFRHKKTFTFLFSFFYIGCFKNICLTSNKSESMINIYWGFY